MTTNDDEAARQPLLSDTDHDVDHQQPQQDESDNRHHRKGRHWLEKLVFASRLRFAISLVVFFVFWTLVALFASGDLPYNRHGHRWPWNRESDYTRQKPGFWNARADLFDSPFCLPDAELLTTADISANQGWRRKHWNMTLELIDQTIDQLTGTIVRKSSGQRRDRVELVMSLVQGEPVHRQVAESPRASSDLNGRSETFRSTELWRALQTLSLKASHQLPGGELVSIDELISALKLNNTRVVSKTGGRLRPAVETTLSDVHHLVQTLLAIHHGVVPPLVHVGLDSLSVGNYFSPRTLNTDGVTASTRSPFTVVRQPSWTRSGQLIGVGCPGNSHTSLQKGGRTLDVLNLLEHMDDRELAIAIDVQRGFTTIVLSDLGAPPRETRPGDCDDREVSLVRWMRSRANDAIYALDWLHETVLEETWAGTYRYQNVDRDASSSASNSFDWIEVDVQIDEGARWITRIEYSLLPSHNDTTATPASAPVSVLKKYNVGGTSDFLASWTCQSSPEALARCFRPLVGDDDSHCSCTHYRFGGNTVSHYRVGLWPSLARKSDGGKLWTIPQAAIRRDTGSYMDQGVGGCPALWKWDRKQKVPEMQKLGYHLEFIEDKEQLRWTGPGLVLDRVKK
ncbi:hypothetical protein EX895_003176 [Sporisorium graminicola]|uniref:Uncharacterized protein n=1 Tax=Sporisorium graminicola TaxID=280036 RepID=A0A4U7KU92_9BASI|nr:hypothetical protein EX895_003176 [Sporisorium graminicola]TKY88080.1 hypothetical protein EX895_003176 [Sporisorium graminicola]